MEIQIDGPGAADTSSSSSVLSPGFTFQIPQNPSSSAENPHPTGLCICVLSLDEIKHHKEELQEFRFLNKEASTELKQFYNILDSIPQKDDKNVEVSLIYYWTEQKKKLIGYFTMTKNATSICLRQIYFAKNQRGHGFGKIILDYYFTDMCTKYFESISSPQDQSSLLKVIESPNFDCSTLLFKMKRCFRFLLQKADFGEIFKETLKPTSKQQPVYNLSRLSNAKKRAMADIIIRKDFAELFCLSIDEQKKYFNYKRKFQADQDILDANSLDSYGLLNKYVQKKTEIIEQYYGVSIADLRSQVTEKHLSAPTFFYEDETTKDFFLIFIPFGETFFEGS